MSNPLRLARHRNVFTYGSLMFEPVWTSVVKGRYAQRRATLTGYRRHAIRGELYPAVVPVVASVIAPIDDGANPGANAGANAPAVASASAVNGRMYLDVGPDDLERLDRFEGAQYRRIECQVSESESGARLDAEVYLFLHPELLLSQDWDEQQFASAGLTEFMKTYAPKP